jgi:glutathione S-transferase
VRTEALAIEIGALSEAGKARGRHGIARLALAEKLVAHRFEEIDIFDASGPPASYLKRHPFGRIPAFEHDGFELYETAAITRYVDEAFPGPALQPGNAGGRARVAQLLSILDSYAYRSMVWDIYVERVRRPMRGEISDEGKIATAIGLAKLCLDELERFMGESSWLAATADGSSLADLHAAPMFAYFRAAPEGSAILASRPRLSAWWERMSLRSSMRATPSPLIDAQRGAGEF